MNYQFYDPPPPPFSDSSFLWGSGLSVAWTAVAYMAYVAFGRSSAGGRLAGAKAVVVVLVLPVGFLVAPVGPGPRGRSSGGRSGSSEM